MLGEGEGNPSGEGFPSPSPNPTLSPPKTFDRWGGRAEGVRPGGNRRGIPFLYGGWFVVAASMPLNGVGALLPVWKRVVGEVGDVLAVLKPLFICGNCITPAEWERSSSLSNMGDGFLFHHLSGVAQK